MQHVLSPPPTPKEDASRSHRCCWFAVQIGSRYLIAERRIPDCSAEERVILSQESRILATFGIGSMPRQSLGQRGSIATIASASRRSVGLA